MALTIQLLHNGCPGEERRNDSKYVLVNGRRHQQSVQAAAFFVCTDQVRHVLLRIVVPDFLPRSIWSAPPHDDRMCLVRDLDDVDRRPSESSRSRK